MTISNRMQQTMVRDAKIKKQLRKSQDLVYDGRDSSSNFYDAITNQNAQSEEASRGSQANRQAVIQYIRQ